MNHHRVHAVLLHLLALSLLVFGLAGPSRAADSAPPPLDRTSSPLVGEGQGGRERPELTGLAIPFIENRGQQDPEVAFHARTLAGTVYVTRAGQLVYALPQTEAGGWTLVEEAVGATPQVSAGPAAATQVSYFQGNDPTRWRSGVSTVHSVELGEPWPGIQVSVQARGKQVEKLFTLAPGASVDAIQMRVRGTQNLTVAEDRSLQVTTGKGEVRFTAPQAWQDIAGERRVVEVAYRQLADDRYGFTLGEHDPQAPVVIDPLLQATYLGGNSDEQLYAMAIHPASGEIYLTGYTTSGNFPGTVGGAQPSFSGSYDVFLARLSADLKTLQQATYLGGSGDDRGFKIVIDPIAPYDVYVPCWTYSTNMPGTVGGAQPSNGGGQDGLVAQLSTDLKTLRQATYLGSAGGDTAYGLAIHPNGDIYVTGYTFGGFPGTTGGAQATFGGGLADPYVARLSPDLKTLLQATYLGGNGADSGDSLAIHPNGGIYVSGRTPSADFPGTTGGAQASYGGAQDTFVVRLNATLTTRLQATYLGGGGDEASSLAIRPNGDINEDIYVGGSTTSTIPGAIGGAQPSSGGGQDAFVARLSVDLKTLIQATYLGGSGSDSAGLAIHPTSGEIYAGGSTTSTNFPGTAGGAQPSSGGGQDGFAARLSADLKTLFQATYLGGSGTDGAGLAIHPVTGEVYAGGHTSSINFPATAGGAQPSYGGGANDLFVARLTADLRGLTVTSIVRADPNPTAAASVTWTVTLSYPVSGLSTSNFALVPTGVTGATITNVTGSGATWTVTATTGTGDGTLGLNLTTTTGVTPAITVLPFAGEVYAINKSAPPVTVTAIALADPNPTAAASVNWTVTFSGAVAGLSTGNFALVPGGGVTGAAISGVSGSGATWTVTAGTGTGDGTLGLNLTNATGLAPAVTNVPFTGAVYTVDKSAPPVTVLSIAAVGSTTTAAPSVSWTVTFSAAVTGVTLGHFSLVPGGGVTGASLTGVAGSGATWTVTAGTGTGNGTLGLNLANATGLTPAVTNVPFTGAIYTVNKTYTVTATAEANGFIAPSGPHTVNHDAITAFTITTNSGYTATVTGCGGSLSGTTYTTAPITGNCAVSARFSPQSHLVSATASAGGVIGPASQTVVHSDTTTFTVTPDSGYTAIVTGCGGILSGNTYTTGPVIGACAVSARFSPPVATLVVTNLNDSGPGSLRQALADAETMPGDNVITFQPGLTGTIVLTSGELVITSNLAIHGPGASVLAVSGNHTSRVFLLSRGSLVPEVVILDGLTIKDGFAAGSDGGGIATTYGQTALTVSHCTLSGNASDQFNVGGGIYGVGDLTVSHSILTGNLAGNEGYAQGGGISQGSGALTISHSTLSGNSARIGGGISVGGGPAVTITISHSTLLGNSATIYGGGIYVGRVPAMTIIHSTLSGNSATLSGGGIYNPDSVITITDSTVSNNTSNTSGYNGGGILNGGWLTMINSTVSGNSSGYNGGGIDNGRWLTMINSTVTGNSATGYGGGISDNGGTTLGNSLVAGNTAANGREVACPGFVSSYLSLGHNLLGENGVSGTSGICVLDPSDLILPGAVSTALGPLADNGGPTRTHLPVAGGPVIDAGADVLIPAGVSIDQRGTARVQNGGAGAIVDVGAVEGSSILPCTVTTIARADSSPTSAATVRWTVTLTEPVTGLSASNFTLVPGGGVSGAAITSVTRTGADLTWTVTADTGSGNGALGLNLTDASGLTPTIANAPFTGEVYTINKTTPPVTVAAIALADPSPTAAASVNWTVTFSGAVAGLSTGNFALVASPGVTGAAISGVTGSGTTWTVTAGTGTGDGTLGLNLANATGLTPAVTNVPFTGAVYTITKSAPAVTVLSIAAVGSTTTAAASVSWTVTFSAAVTGVTLGHFSLVPGGGVTGASLTGVAGSGATWTVTAGTGNGNGTLGLNLTGAAGIAPPVTTPLPVVGAVYTLDRGAPPVAGLLGVAWSGSLFAAVGAGGAIRTSPDGIAWTARPAGASQDLYGIAWSGRQFVAVGDLGTILTSPDGVAWTARASGATQPLLGVAWSGYQFAAAGGGGALLTSPDGIVWTAQPAGTADLAGVAWSGRQFVTVGSDGARVALARPWGDDRPLAGNVWAMIGLPAEPVDPTVQGVFGARLPGAYGADWVVYGRDDATDQYVKLLAADVLAQGAGYWLKSSAAAAPAVAGAATPVTTANPHCPSLAGCHEIPLTPPASGDYRYHLIGMPFPYPVGWWDARLVVDGVAHTLDAAQTAGYVNDTYWIWNGNGYDAHDSLTPGMIGVVQPWQGVWLKVNAASRGHAVTLLLPCIPKYGHAAPPAPAAGGRRLLDWLIAPAAAEPAAGPPPARGLAEREARRAALGRDVHTGRAWYVRLIAEEPTGPMQDRNSVFGQLADAAVGHDRHDLPELAPFGAPFLTVVFPHSDWGPQAGDYASDYRPNRAAPRRGLPPADWRFELRADRPGYTVRLRWEGPPGVLARSELLDEDTGARYPAADPATLRDGLPVAMTAPTRRFTWRYTGRRSP